jgi:hypothetical protein
LSRAGSISTPSRAASSSTRTGTAGVGHRWHTQTQTGWRIKNHKWQVSLMKLSHTRQSMDTRTYDFSKMAIRPTGYTRTQTGRPIKNHKWQVSLMKLSQPATWFRIKSSFFPSQNANYLALIPNKLGVHHRPAVPAELGVFCRRPCWSIWHGWPHATARLPARPGLAAVATAIIGQLAGAGTYNPVTKHDKH